MSSKRRAFTAEELRGNWQHELVGQEFTYTLQVGSGLVSVKTRTAAQGIMLPIEELRGVVAEWDATIGGTMRDRSKS